MTYKEELFIKAYIALCKKHEMCFEVSGWDSEIDIAKDDLDAHIFDLMKALEA